MLGKFTDCRKFEQVRKRNFRLQELLQIRMHGHQEQRITAEVEEIVVESDILDFQNALPELRECALEFATGNAFKRGCPCGSEFQVGESRTIYLAVFR